MPKLLLRASRIRAVSRRVSCITLHSNAIDAPKKLRFAPRLPPEPLQEQAQARRNLCAQWWELVANGPTAFSEVLPDAFDLNG